MFFAWRAISESKYACDLMKCYQLHFVLIIIMDCQSEWKSGGNMREELGMVIPQLEGLRKRKLERMCQFVELLVELQNVSKEISSNDNRYDTTVDETDLSGKRLEELRGQLLDLQNEKVCFLIFGHGIRPLHVLWLRNWGLKSDQQQLKNIEKPFNFCSGEIL